MEVLKIENHERVGGDCLIKDEIVLFIIHDIYVVMNIRKYIGWCDNGLDYSYRKEFNNENEAINYLDKLSASNCNL